jgi:hypothetical protein
MNSNEEIFFFPSHCLADPNATNTVTWRDRVESAETETCHIFWAAFASPRTAQSLCVTPLEQGAGEFFDRGTQMVAQRPFTSPR